MNKKVKTSKKKSLQGAGGVWPGQWWDGKC